MSCRSLAICGPGRAKARLVWHDDQQLAARRLGLLPYRPQWRDRRDGRKTRNEAVRATESSGAMQRWPSSRRWSRQSRRPDFLQEGNVFSGRHLRLGPLTLVIEGASRHQQNE